MYCGKRALNRNFSYRQLNIICNHVHKNIKYNPISRIIQDYFDGLSDIVEYQFNEKNFDYKDGNVEIWHDSFKRQSLLLKRAKQIAKQNNSDYKEEFKTLQNRLKQPDYTRIDKLHTKIMYVSKDKQTKGQKSFDPTKFTKSRTVEFMPKKDYQAYQLCHDINEALNHCYKWEDNQNGFLNDRNIFTAALQHCNRKVVKSIANADLENAFNQIGGFDLYYLLRKAFKLNKYKALYLATLCTGKDGNLYQGQPLAPIIYNLFTSHLANRFLKLSKKNTYDLVINLYADDLLMSSNLNTFSWKFIRFVLKIIKEEGFKVNIKKTTLMSNRQVISFNGFQFIRNRKGVLKASPKYHKSFFKKLRLITFLYKKVDPTLKAKYIPKQYKMIWYNRFGNKVDIAQCYRGQQEWLKCIEETFQSATNHLVRG